MDTRDEDLRCAGLRDGEQRLVGPLRAAGVQDQGVVELTAFPRLPGGTLVWENKWPDVSIRWGYGRGFPGSEEAPRFRDSKAAPSLPDAWVYLTFLFASEAFVDLLRSLDPSGFSAVEVDYRFATGGSPPQAYHLVDFTRVLKAIDWQASGARVSRHAGVCYLSPRPPVVIANQATGLHFFRDEACAATLFVSRTLARMTQKARLKVGKFRSLQDGSTMRRV